MKKMLPILQFVVISFVVGYLSRVLQGTSMEAWYPGLVKSSLTPPGYIFSLVWGVLYLLMGISAGIVWSARTVYSWVLTVLFAVQLLLNLAWSFAFFWMRSPVAGIVVLALLLACVAFYVIGCYNQSRVAAYLNIPYLMWLVFALYLNSYIVMSN
jgi:tryptophan-rich sensory protein